jgi:hypothetical protein
MSSRSIDHRTDDGSAGGPLTRRAFLRRGSLILAGGAAGAAALDALAAANARAKPAVRFGLLTDVHYADRPPLGLRYYRESIAKVREAVGKFNERKATLAFELGDFIDAAPDLKTEIGFLKTIEAEYARFRGLRRHVLGNHCVWSLTKKEFLDTVGEKDAHCSLDHGGFHFIVLDACYRSDGQPYGRKNFNWMDSNVPPAELRWLAADLKATDKKCLAFVHQRLDVENHYGVKNASAVRKVLEDSGKVLAVFQGHYHRNDYRQIAGIHYCTLRAVVEGSGPENNAYAVVDVLAGGTIRVDGFRKQADYAWQHTSRERRDS